MIKSNNPKRQPGTILYFAFAGIVKSYRVVKPDNMQPCAGCDILIADENGQVSSGNSSGYHLNQSEAIKTEIDKLQSSLKTHRRIANRLETEIKAFAQQLVDLKE